MATTTEEQATTAAAEVEETQLQQTTAASEEAAVQKDTQGDDQNLVIYGDGGCRPNPGPGGWGIHGYLFTPGAPKKTQSHPEYLCTATGYTSRGLSSTRMTGEGKKEREQGDRELEVTVIEYIDGYGSFAGSVTNNVAEIEAAIQALLLAGRYVLKTMRYKTDSKHVVEGVNSWARAWARNNWLRADGTAPANVEYWKRLMEAHEQLVSRGVQVTVEWVKAHTDDSLVHDTVWGNVCADKLATAGLTASKAGDVFVKIETSLPDGYWKYQADRHPFISYRRMYFNTLMEYNKEGEYYIGEHGKDDELFGKRMPDGAFAVVKLAVKDPVLEVVRQHQSTLAGGVDCIVMALLDQIYQPTTHQEIFEMGAHSLVQRSPYKLDMEDLKRQAITREFRPQRLAMRAVDAITDLSMILDKYIAKDPSLALTDLTSILYETSVKTSKKGEPKTEIKLKSDYNVGFAALNVDANYLSDDGTVKSVPVTLSLGIDMLDRNALKRLEDKSPRVQLVSWVESPNCFRYATIVEAGSDIGIWAGVYSNLRIVA